MKHNFKQMLQCYVKHSNYCITKCMIIYCDVAILFLNFSQMHYITDVFIKHEFDKTEDNIMNLVCAPLRVQWVIVFLSTSQLIEYRLL